MRVLPADGRLVENADLIADLETRSANHAQRTILVAHTRGQLAAYLRAFVKNGLRRRAEEREIAADADRLPEQKSAGSQLYRPAIRAERVDRLLNSRSRRFGAWLDRSCSRRGLGYSEI